MELLTARHCLPLLTRSLTTPALKLLCAILLPLRLPLQQLPLSLPCQPPACD